MYITVRQASEKWGISDRRVRVLCSQGKIPGAYQEGRNESCSRKKPRLIEAVPEQEPEKTLREKLKEKIENNNIEIIKLTALYERLKDKVRFKKIIDQYPARIEKIKDMNMQLETICNLSEENLTQEIVELAEELLGSKA